MSEASRIVTVRRCTICGADHVEVEAFPLPAPFVQGTLTGETVSYGWRAECPTTGDTLLLTDGQTWTK